MTITTTAVRNAKPKDKPYKLYDEKGLFIQVTPMGVSGGDLNIAT